MADRPRIAIIGPVFPYRAGIPYCTTRLAAEMARTCDVTILSFKRQYPRWFYPGGDDIDESLRPLTPAGALYYRFVAAINLSTADMQYSNRGFKSANILLNGQVPMRARLTTYQ